MQIDVGEDPAAARERAIRTIAFYSGEDGRER